ncbi:hypothetical protein CCACVL1_10068 [Corchorus capsularis]|uniref:Uncharacterized protein n=1 Tax=Corchorus capsularis TaxID=210143 RepID=A0A1R3ISS1_COCAP|nr:hypothetical protein CCACVL1_10068 [Corchorus capsularis]
MSVMRHAGLNRKVGLQAKSDIFVSSKAGHGGKGGGTNIAHLPGRQPKNSASSLGRPPIFLLSAAAIFHLNLGLILAFPSLLLKLF